VPIEVMQVAEERATYDELSGLGPLWECDFEFLSPTYFSRNGRDYLLPDPELIVHRLVDRWNDHVPDGPLAVDDGMARGLASRIILKSHQLRTVRTQGHGGHCGSGFVGK